jgi:hypothetical protein
MRRPDVRRNKESLGTGLQGDFEQYLAVKPENGPAVGMDIADCLEFFAQALRGIEIGKNDDVMDFAGLAVFFVNRTYFTRNDETDIFFIEAVFLPEPAF